MRTKINIQTTGRRRTGYLAAGLSLFLLAMAGCTKDELESAGGDVNPDSDEVLFDAYIQKTDKPDTRAVGGVYVVPQLYSYCDFNMTAYASYTSKEGTQVTHQESSVYEIPSGSMGTISRKKTDAGFAKPLRWFSLDQPHYFYGWTAYRCFEEYTREYAQTLVDKGTLTQAQVDAIEKFPIEKQDNGDYTINFVDNTLEDGSSPTTGYWTPPQTGTYPSGAGNTYNSTDKTNYVYKWKNGGVLERLIGTCTPPTIFRKNGMYVSLQYRHLVSKIMLHNLLVVDNSTGTSSSSLRGYITFYGMPTSATLYTNPRDKEGNPVAPYVAMPDGWNYPQTEGVRYAITNTSQYYYWEKTSSPYYAYYGCSSNGSVYADNSNYPYFRDAWYICPEVDFSKISFKIELYEVVNGQWIPHTKFGSQGAYYGDFKNVKFERSKTESDYDAKVDSEGNNTDLTTLHAGEYMILTMTLTGKGNPSVNVDVSSSTGTWNSPTGRNANTHVHQGLYDLTELKEMNTITSSDNEDEKKTFCDMHCSGYTTETDPNKEEYPNYGDYPKFKDKDKGLEIIELYDDIVPEGDSSTENYGSTANYADKINVDDDHMLDGNGHTIGCNTSGDFNIGNGNIRDVYLKYYNSGGTIEYIVYIDKNGYVWKVNQSTYEMTLVVDNTHPKGYNVNEMNKNPININISTGKLS